MTRVWIGLVMVALVGGCGSGVAHGPSDNNRDVGEACDEDDQCASGVCLPYGTGQVCTEPCLGPEDCTGETECVDLGAVGQWCLPDDCVPDCADRCCGGDGCGGQCPDTCVEFCNPTSCACEAGCSPVGALQACSAHGSCSGTQECLSDGTWSGCENAGWQCTTPGSPEACDASGCTGTRTCQADCLWSTCEADCPTDETCCPGSGCVDVTSDPSNCGQCGRVCTEATQLCYDTACPEGCARNGSEICDDEGFQVPAPPVQVVLVCDNDNGGVAYISTNTGPVMSDGVARCQGWETTGQDAWDHLDYLATMDCNTAGQTLVVDLSAYVGQHLHFGSHDQPTGGGHMTNVCIAFTP